jgi:hypothetical protein
MSGPEATSLSRGDVHTDDADLYQQLARLKGLHDQVIFIYMEWWFRLIVEGGQIKRCLAGRSVTGYSI